MKTQMAAGIAATILALAAADAVASTATATLSNFKIELFDLNKGSGAPPSVVFQSVQGGTFVAAETGATDAGGHLVRSTDEHFGAQPFGNAAANEMDGSSLAFATLAGDPFDGAASVLAFASGSRAGAYSASTVMLGDGASYAPFTLSPETRMVISADASATANSTIDDDFATAWASAFLKLTDETGLGAISYGSVESQQGGTRGGSPFTSSDDERIEVTFDNLGSDSIDGIFFGSIDTYVADIAPVPEPAGTPLILSALALLAWRGRRRQSRQG